MELLESNPPEPVFTKPVIKTFSVITDTQVQTCWIGSRRFVVASGKVKDHIKFMSSVLDHEKYANTLTLIGRPKTYHLPGIESTRYMSTTHRLQSSWCPMFKFVTRISMYGVDITLVGADTQSHFDTHLFDLFKKYKPIPEIIKYYDHVNEKHRQVYCSYCATLNYLDIPYRINPRTPQPTLNGYTQEDFDTIENKYNINRDIITRHNIGWCEIWNIPVYMHLLYSQSRILKHLGILGQLDFYMCSIGCNYLHPKIIRYTIHNTYSSKITPDQTTLSHTIKSLSKKKGVLFDGDINPDGSVKVRVQAGALPYHSVGYKLARHRYGDCIVKIGLFDDSLVAHERECLESKYIGQKDNKFRTNKCLVIGIVKLDSNYLTFDTITEARSCVHTSELVYKVGDLLVVEDFDLDLNKTCVSGIHFFYDPTCVLDFSGSEYTISDSSLKRLRNYTAFPHIKKPHTHIIKKLFNKVTGKTPRHPVYDFVVKNGSLPPETQAYHETVEEYPIDMSMINTAMCGHLKLKTIRTMLIENTKDDVECVLCTLPYNTTTVKTFLPCGHHYCKECVTSSNRWMYKNSKCPLCKKSFTNRQ